MAFKKRYFGNMLPVTKSVIILIMLLTDVKLSSGTNNLVMKDDTGANLSSETINMSDHTNEGKKNEQNVEEVLITNENHIQITTDLMSQMAELKEKFEQHVSKSNVKDIIKTEKIAILMAAKNRLESKMKVLKEENLNQTIRISQLEKKSILKSDKTNNMKTDDSAPSVQLAATSSPIRQLYKSSNNIPSSCKDLSTNGHNLNGIYLLYDITVRKMSTAFCNFNNNKGTQQMLGFVDAKSLPKGVHFYAQRRSHFSKSNAIIPFDRVLMNEGSGLNGTTGIFRAPKPGIYRFLFHGTKSHLSAASLHIDLRVNGVNVGNAYAHHYQNVGMLSVGVHAVVKLKIGDEVILFKAGDGWLYDDDTPDTHYSGWLLEEELVI